MQNVRKWYENCAKTVRKMYEHCSETVRIYVVIAEITTKNAAAEHFSHLFVKKWAKIFEHLAWSACPKSGGCIFLEKNRRRQPTPEHMGFLSGKIQDGLHGMASWRKPHFPKTWFWSWLGSIWLQMEFWPAPWAGNFEADLLTGTKSSHHVKNGSKYSGIWVGLGRDFADFPDFSRNDPKWSPWVLGLLLGGLGSPGTIIW